MRASQSPVSHLQCAPSAGRVLVVDDTAANRELLSQELEDEGFEVCTARDGPGCLSIASSWRPDVILLDIQMPGMNGIEVCTRLKQSSETHGIPVLFLTAKRTDEASVVEALNAGGNDFLSKPYSLPILVARVASQVTISRAHAQLRAMAMTDPLTGVFSRRHLFTTLTQMVTTAGRTGPYSLSCLLIDVDHFKQVNDQLGHLEGDRVLREIAQAIADTIRESDVVARFGGEEFVVLLPATDMDGALAVAEHVRVQVAERCAPVTISVGVSTKMFSAYSSATPPGPRMDTRDVVRVLLEKADEAVYRAKHTGRDRVVAGPWEDAG